MRLDMDVDGQPNSVDEVNTQAEPMGETNPYGIWEYVFAESTLLLTEQAAQRIIDPLTGRY